MYKNNAIFAQFLILLAHLQPLPRPCLQWGGCCVPLPTPHPCHLASSALNLHVPPPKLKSWLRPSLSTLTLADRLTVSILIHSNWFTAVIRTLLGFVYHGRIVDMTLNCRLIRRKVHPITGSCIALFL